MPKVKPEGIDGLLQERTPPIEELTLVDWFASFALLRGAEPDEAFAIAYQMIKERKLKT